MKVFVYFNLHKKCFSVRSMKTGRVINHTMSLTLENCVFKVSEAGRKRVLKEKRKNVHAGVVGYLTEDNNTTDCLTKVTYNPYKYSSFVEMETEKPIFSAKKVLLSASPLVTLLAVQ
jgi:hypothetical protein